MDLVLTHCNRGQAPSHIFTKYTRANSGQL
ncbi:hypothetical protein M2392_005985 [Pseudomonas grimontii]|nr:hypothetical protein [Pseudomonas grimontii]